MRIRRDYQVPCPACHARKDRPCTGKEGERLPGVHFQRTTALRTATLAAIRALYTVNIYLTHMGAQADNEPRLPAQRLENDRSATDNSAGLWEPERQVLPWL